MRHVYPDLCMPRLPPRCLFLTLHFSCGYYCANARGIFYLYKTMELNILPNTEMVGFPLVGRSISFITDYLCFVRCRSKVTHLTLAWDVQIGLRVYTDLCPDDSGYDGGDSFVCSSWLTMLCWTHASNFGRLTRWRCYGSESAETN